MEIGCVCHKTCNNGWMQKVEDLNIPIVGAIMCDIAFMLDAEQQVAVSRWAVMKAMVQDAIETRARSMFYTLEERYAMRETQTIPANTRVWLGRCSRSTLYLDANDITLDMCAGKQTPKTASSCLNTIVVGHLAIQVFTVHVPEQYLGRPFEISTVGSGPWDNLLIPVWPVSELANWPPRLFLKDNGIQHLAARFSGGIRL
jgi:hypothetical protein